jgi:hypothetical protein
MKTSWLPRHILFLSCRLPGKIAQQNYIILFVQGIIIFIEISSWKPGEKDGSNQK